MECPKCNSEFKTIEYEGIEVDRCTQCEGIWFDILEHQELKKIKGSESIDSGNPAKGQAYNKIDKINCPKCKTQMIRMVDSRQPHIWYEACSICNGVFFDAGEFKDYKKYTFSDFMKSFKKNERT